jgi:hypothetical protein
MDRKQNKRERLKDLLSWLSAHPSVTEPDRASEFTWDAFHSLSLTENAAACIGSTLRDHAEADCINRVVGSLSCLLDTIGNCETEERNQKALLWIDVIRFASEAQHIIESVH